MESRVKLTGHPVHPMLIVFPLGLLATSLIFDIVYLGTGEPKWTTIAEYMIGAGILGGLLAAVFGLADWLAIPRGTRAKSIGLRHGLLNVMAVLLFVASWLLRLPSPATPPTAAIVLSFVAVGIALVGGWLGGELVYRLGVGVYDNAGLNAPSSLSHPSGQHPIRPSGRRAA